METKGLISVVIPVYNVEKYLNECVDSVLSQTYKNYEIILVNDGSTDGSGKICDEYQGRFNNVFTIHQENAGLSNARNTGLNAANGEYVYFLDSDDYIINTAFEKLVETAENEKADFIFFDAASFADPEDDFQVKQSYVRKNTYSCDNGINLLTRLFENSEFHSAVPLTFFKKSFLDKNKLLFVENILYEDVVFSYQAYCAAQKVAYCKESLYFRRYRKNSIMTSKKTKKHFCSCKIVCEELVQYALKNNLLNLQISKKYITRFAFNVFNNYEKLSNEDKKECKKELQEFKKYILNKNCFESKALKMRCYGKAYWFIYKVIEKTVRKVIKQ